MDKSLPITIVDTAKYSVNGAVTGLSMPYSQLIYCDTGTGELFAHHALPSKFREGDIMYVSGARMHGFTAHNARLYMISFTGTYERLIPEYFKMGGSCVIPGCADLRDMFTSIISNTDKSELQRSEELYELIVSAGIKSLEQAEKAATADGFILEKLIKYITENYSKSDFSMDDALTAAGTSRRTAENVLRLATGMTAEEYFTFFRLENLRNVLFLRPYLNLRRCALTNGFSDFDEFRSSFGAAYGIAPEKFVDISSNQTGISHTLKADL